MPREYVTGLPNGEESGRRRGSWCGREAGDSSVGEDLTDQVQRSGAIEALVIRLLGKIGIVGGRGFAGTRIAILK